jgi:exopolysaccharide biosynthesis polyprenyl glycosylphosphotransferase
MKTCSAHTSPSSTAQPVAPEMAPHRPLAAAVCRGLDLILGGAMLVLLAAPLAVLLVLVKLTSRGPAIYRQVRVGRGGRPFVIYKLRTMRVDAEAATGPIWARRADPRCTPLGHFLRRWCLDELPQLINVLRGDMSLVGPRPERPYFVREFSQRLPHYNERHQVRPGMTGWAQVNGWRGDTSLEKRLEFDLYYAHHWSVGLYLQILLLTPLRVVVEKQNENPARHNTQQAA